jgi:hypothetical protein
LALSLRCWGFLSTRKLLLSIAENGKTFKASFLTELMVIKWKWRARGKLNREWRELSWRMSEQEAAAWSKSEGREIERIEGSAEVRTDLRGETDRDGVVTSSRRS